MYVCIIAVRTLLPDFQVAFVVAPPTGSKVPPTACSPTAMAMATATVSARRWHLHAV